MATEIEIEVVRAWPDRCESLRMRVAAGSTVAQALTQAAEGGFAAAGEARPDMLAVFGRTATPATVLQAGDRIELLRPLEADPKERRRERAGRGR